MSLPTNTNTNTHAAEKEFSDWIAEGDIESAREAAERRERERSALRSFNFEHAKFDLQRALYARAIGK
jgi:hypothetical protein